MFNEEPEVKRGRVENSKTSTSLRRSSGVEQKTDQLTDRCQDTVNLPAVIHDHDYCINEVAPMPIGDTYLINGHLYREKYQKDVRIGNREVKLSNTCSSDSLIELFSHSHQRFDAFRRAVDQFKIARPDDFLNLISTYARNGETELIYEMRARVLMKARNCQGDTLNCWSAIYESTAVVLRNRTDFNVHRTYTCLLGCTERKVDAFCLDLPRGGHFLNSLQNKINNLLQPKQLNCPQCESILTVNQQLNIGTFMIVNTENEYLGTNGRIIKTCCLQDIPAIIHLPTGNYKLSGIVKYSPGHFIPICKLENGEWEIRNDLLLENTKRILSEAEVQEQITPSCILFVKSQ